MTDFEERPADTLDDEIVEVTGLLRRIVARKIGELDAVEDIVQETVARLLAARQRLDGRAVGPYAIVTARNLVASRYERADTANRHEHRLVDLGGAAEPDERMLEQE